MPCWFAGLCVLAAFGATALVRDCLAESRFLWAGLGVVCLAVVAAAGMPDVYSGPQGAAKFNRRKRSALAKDDIVEMRIATSEARDCAWLTFGWGSFGLVALAFICFVLTNDAAVGKTFFFLPLMSEKWWLVTKSFLMNNIFIFVVAEILVLVWGLVVALARLLPGPAGQPIRALAIIYCDVFRGLPAVVTLYLVGFGLPISGLPDLIVPKIVGLFMDLSALIPSGSQDGNPHPGDLVVHPGADPDLWRLCGRSLSRRHRKHPLEPGGGGALARPLLYADHALCHRAAGGAPHHGAAAQ